MAPESRTTAHGSAERHRKSIALQTLLRKNKRYDPKKAKADKYYQKAKLLRSYHKMLKRETTTPSGETNRDPNGTAERRSCGEIHPADVEAEMDDSSDEPQPSMEGSEDEASVDDGVICKFYSKGNGCRAGASCRFKHQGQPARKVSLCKFYTSRAGCQKGSRCKFRHEGTPQIVPEEKASKKSALVKIWEQKKADAEADRIAKERELERRRAEARQRQEERTRKSRNLLKRTATGQPLMKGLVTNLLGKIMEQTRTDAK